jgi:hypothetical protein
VTGADDLTGPPSTSGRIEDRVTRADLWEAGADERERLADERERLADERERLADEREVHADRHERHVDSREENWPGYAAYDVDDGVEQAYAEAALRRAEAGVRRAEAQLARARDAATRLEARRIAARAALDRATAADRGAAATTDEDRFWLADRRDFVAAERDRLADLRDRAADERDTTADRRDREADQRERQTLRREHNLSRGARYADSGPRAAGPPDPTDGPDQPADPRHTHQRARAATAARRRAAARQRAAETWGPAAYGPMLVASFAESARDLLAIDDIDEALRRVLKFTVDAVSGCHWASVTIYRNGRVDQTIVTDPVAAELDASQLTTALGPAPEALHTEHPVYAPRLVDSPRWPELSATAARVGAASALSHGLFLNQEARWSVLGVLTLYSETPEAFRDEDREFITIVSAYLSVAIGIAQRNDDIQRREAALHRGLTTRDVIGQAKGILMERRRMSAGEAFDLLRRASQRLNRKLADVAQQLAETGELPT